ISGVKDIILVICVIYLSALCEIGEFDGIAMIVNFERFMGVRVIIPAEILDVIS
ncbi:MAG: hypothetical protein GX629_09415, partial [Phycisphaerae bacterium]|nr:hypothetical protein [Phycisphaerae bacterium]